ncbi:hypothetical protein NLM23_11725 [Bradyrhizobium cajani]|nr:helix-turn-helix domain-containing protein [Bradyrhizobium cajani]MCP3369725.1 hypothetical protein [Bradyrhizobium cajani]
MRPLTAASAATRGNQIRAATLLGLNRNTLRKKIRDLDIQVYRSGDRLSGTVAQLPYHSGAEPVGIALARPPSAARSAALKSALLQHS